jgi:hypothetical protein
MDYLDQLEWVKVIEITKTPSGLHWGQCPLEISTLYKQGVYRLLVQDIEHIVRVRKNGIYGEGKSKGINKRISQYRSATNNLLEWRKGNKKDNGSFKTCDILDKKLKNGEKAVMISAKLPDNWINDNGFPCKIDLYEIEYDLKQQTLEEIWLK